MADLCKVGDKVLIASRIKLEDVSEDISSKVGDGGSVELKSYDEILNSGNSWLLFKT